MTGLVADVARASTSDGAPVIQYPWLGGQNQRWQVSQPKDGYVSITAEHSGLCLTGSRSVVRQRTCDPADAAQQWKVTEVDGGVRLSTASSPSRALGIGRYTVDRSRILALRRVSSAPTSTVWRVTTL